MASDTGYPSHGHEHKRYRDIFGLETSGQPGGMGWKVSGYLFLYAAQRLRQKTVTLEMTKNAGTQLPVLLLGLMTLGQMFCFHAKGQVGGILPAKFYGLGLNLSRAVLFAFPTFFLLLSMEKYRKLFLPFSVLPALLYFVAVGFQAVVPAFSVAAYRIDEAFYITAAALLVCAVLEYWDRNPMFRLFLPGFALSVDGIGAACLLSWLRDGELHSYIHYLLSEATAHLPDNLLYWWSTFMLLLCFLVSILSKLQSMAMQKAQIQALFVQESMALEQLALVRESDESLRRMRHETVKHYTVLQKLTQAGELDRLGNYLNSLLTGVEAIPAIAYVAHPAINAVLTIMLARAQKLEIKIEREVSAPDTLPFPIQAGKQIRKILVDIQYLSPLQVDSRFMAGSFCIEDVPGIHSLPASHHQEFNLLRMVIIPQISVDDSF